MLTLTGAGGCGKTRLALQVAADLLERWPDGAWWVELAPLVAGELIGSALAGVLDAPELPGRSALDAAIDRLAGQRALVVLDNCEHLLEPAAVVAEALLRGCPNVTVLATSRPPLGVGGEADWRVPSLSLPAERSPEPVEAVTQSDAVQLFIERAVKVRPNFAVNADNAPAIAQICHDLDGIPLAIELAAARVRVLSPVQISAGLGDRFRLLTGGARSAMPRQQTLRASVDWSHQQLSDQERLLFRRLAVFAGGWTLDAVEQVCEGDGIDGYAVLDLLTSLVDKSLVLADEGTVAVRYRMLETVREYALDLLRESGEHDALGERHGDFFLALAERVAPELVTVNQREWLEELDPEAANLGVAIGRAAETDPESALRLCFALTVWWKLRGRFAAAELAYARALDSALPAPSSLHAKVLWGRAYLLTYAGDYATAIAAAQEALAVAEAVQDHSRWPVHSTCWARSRSSRTRSEAGRCSSAASLWLARRVTTGAESTRRRSWATRTWSVTSRTASSSWPSERSRRRQRLASRSPLRSPTRSSPGWIRRRGDPRPHSPACSRAKRGCSRAAAGWRSR